MASNHNLSQLCFNLFPDLKHSMNIESTSNFLISIIGLRLYDRMYLFLGNALKHLVVKEQKVFNVPQMVQIQYATTMYTRVFLERENDNGNGAKWKHW